MWQQSNSEVMVPREMIEGSIRGVDFGPRVFVLARAERPMLLWLGGHSWSVNGHQRYAESHLTIIRDRVRMDGWRNYESCKPEGGRLTVARLEAIRDKIVLLFGEERWPGIVHAVETKQTLLIEGGGARPQPHPSLGRDEYLRWRAEAASGLSA